MALPLLLFGGQTLLTLYGMKQQREANKASLEFNNETLRHNQEVSKILAEDAISRGERAVRKQRRTIKQVAGAQRAQIAANGFVVNEDTASQVVSDTINWGEVDVATLRSNARNEALQIEASGVQAQVQANQNRVSTNYSNQATLINGVSNILGAGSNYYNAVNR